MLRFDPCFLRRAFLNKNINELITTFCKAGNSVYCSSLPDDLDSNGLNEIESCLTEIGNVALVLSELEFFTPEVTTDLASLSRHLKIVALDIQEMLPPEPDSDNEHGSYSKDRDVDINSLFVDL